jgi:hypothetical protein
VNAKLEEKERRSGRVVILFALTVRTKPSMVKYEVEGNATLTGKDTLIDKVLEVDPKSKIPHVFHHVYQHVFTTIYMLAALMGTIYPPPDLLFSGGQGIPVQSLKRAEQAERTEADETTKTTEMTEVAKATESPELTKPARPAEPTKTEVKLEETPPQQTKASAT